jgi:hypothetical protein
MTPILNEILQLPRGISTAAAELLLTRRGACLAAGVADARTMEMV